MKPMNNAAMDTLSRKLGASLLKRGRTLSTAESCTGGMVAEVITDVPGSSRYFVGGVVGYSNGAKAGVLRVGRGLLARHGAVSKEVAGAMAKGVKRLMHTDCAIAVTGIAGPDGGTARKPVGLVYIAVADRGKVHIQKFIFKGDRHANREMATRRGIRMLMALLRSCPPRPSRCAEASS